MGCCFSINAPNSKQDQNHLKIHQPDLRSLSPKSNLTHEQDQKAPPPPPPPPVEEESVKEVLSETPISKPQVSILMAETRTQLPKLQYSKCPIFEKAEEQVSEEVSQITETCSISESFSTVTTTVTGTEKREDEVTSKRSTTREGTQNRNRNRSQSKRSCYGNRIGGRESRPKSPARTTPEHPPEKRIPTSSRPVRWRESGQVRRDPSEGSGRRSRSPSASGRVTTGNGRCQVKPPPGTAGRRLPPPVKGVVKMNGVSERAGEENDVVPHEESLDNPHVSLECFIFL